MAMLNNQRVHVKALKMVSFCRISPAMDSSHWVIARLLWQTDVAKETNHLDVAGKCWRFVEIRKIPPTGPSINRIWTKWLRMWNEQHEPCQFGADVAHFVYVLPYSCRIARVKMKLFSTQNWKIISGWWFQPLWKILVSWDDSSQYMEK